MANVFKNEKKRNVSTATTVYTAPALTTAVLVGMVVANVDASATIKVTVLITASALDYHLVKDVPILPGASLQLVSGEKIVLQTGELIEVTSTGGLSDVVCSFMEISQ